MNKPKDIPAIFVTGDVTIDWNIARMRQEEGIAQMRDADNLAAAFRQYGGAAMLADLISAIAEDLRQKELANVEVRQISLPKEKITPDDSRFPHSYSMWAPFSLEDGSNKKVWRVQEYLGLNPAHTEANLTEIWRKVTDEETPPNLIVISDANLGFRQHPELWPATISSNAVKPWILVNTSRPVAQGPLWDQLYTNHSERLIAVMTVNHFRSGQVQVSRNLSWERTAQDLVWELLYNPSLNRLEKCAYIIISFGPAGVLLFSHVSESRGATLYFDPSALEGEWGRQYKGFMIGYNSCLIGGIIRELMINRLKADVSKGIKAGIRAMRSLHIEGYGNVDRDPTKIQLVFPAHNLAARLSEDVSFISTSPVMSPPRDTIADSRIGDTRFWTILEDKYTGQMESIAERIVTEGLEAALPGVPLGKFGRLKTVDRREIESLHSISSLMQEYIKRRQQSPLSIAVFGPPGSGKSFTIKEVADSVVPGAIVPLTFNLSQFRSPGELLAALHQVRDKALSGKIPLVFWDEFDTSLENQPLGWLRYFLVPMQDGEFQEGQITHPIGNSIFVFAGGTSYSMDAFGASLDEKQQRAAKLPDFVSRLKGFLNILGPNQCEGDNAQARNQDPYYIFRRAILLRSILERSAPLLFHTESGRKILAIDLGVLRAFLLTREYKHGARSLEAIIAMSQLADSTSFERSHLPSEAQLNLHVDGRDFFSIMQHLESESLNLEKLDEIPRGVFREDLRVKNKD